MLDSVAILGTKEDSGDSGGNDGGKGRRTVVITNQPVTFPESPFVSNPLDRIEVNNTAFIDADGSRISHASAKQQISIESTFINYQQARQHYSFIVQITDEEGYAVDIIWHEGMIESGQTEHISSLWMPQDGGRYTPKIFIWDGMDNPSPLSNVTTDNISVG